MNNQLTDTTYTEADFIVGDHDSDITTTLNFKVLNPDGTSKSVTYGNFHSGITDTAITLLRDQINTLSKSTVDSAFKIEKRNIQAEAQTGQSRKSKIKTKI